LATLQENNSRLEILSVQYRTCSNSGIKRKRERERERKERTTDEKWGANLFRISLTLALLRSTSRQRGLNRDSLARDPSSLLNRLRFHIALLPVTPIAGHPLEPTGEIYRRRVNRVLDERGCVCIYTYD
jgi:hypothetical protein